MTERLGDRLLAVLVAVFAASLVAASRAIEDSMLSDAVGAGGVPQGVGIAMFIAAVALFLKTFIGSDHRDAPTKANGKPAARQGAAARVAGLVLILIGYGIVLPIAGYPIAVSLLVLASGWLAGAALRMPLLLCAVLSGPLLWALFDWLLQVRMPIGTLWE